MGMLLCESADDGKPSRTWSSWGQSSRPGQLGQHAIFQQKRGLLGRLRGCVAQLVHLSKFGAGGWVRPVVACGADCGLKIAGLRPPLPVSSARYGVGDVKVTAQSRISTPKYQTEGPIKHARIARNREMRDIAAPLCGSDILDFVQCIPKRCSAVPAIWHLGRSSRLIADASRRASD
jgi:hypothetical protein